MNTVDGAIERSLWCYPSLFKNRTQVLRHILCVIGCGWEWGPDGQPRCDWEPLATKPKQRASMAYRRRLDEIEKIYDRKVFGEQFIERARVDAYNLFQSELREINDVHTTLDYRVATPGPPWEERFGDTFQKYLRHDRSREYMLAYNVPDNATDEWKAAVAEILAVMEPLWDEAERSSRKKSRSGRRSMTPQQPDYQRKGLRRAWREARLRKKFDKTAEKNKKARDKEISDLIARSKKP